MMDINVFVSANIPYEINRKIDFPKISIPQKRSQLKHLPI